MAELLGKATGVSGGKGGSMHLASAEHRYWGGHAIVGGHLPLATGVGLAIRYKEEPDAVICVLGEGTTNIGYFHESINLAAVWNLPVVFLVENNQYGMGTEVSRASAVTNIFEKGCAYDIANRQINGQDVIEMYENVTEALEHARKEGPVLLEALTYRYSGHSMGDPERYRTKAEIEEWRARDPIARLEDYMIGKKMADQPDFDAIRHKVEEELVEIVRFAEESPEPEDVALCEYVFVDPIPHR
jgi:pyruvate dehydrogenase E1 component alpha subunit